MPPRTSLQVLAALSLFAAIYFAAFTVAAFAMRGLYQWAWLVAGIGATIAVIELVERGQWRLGLAAPPRTAARELALGALFAIALIMLADTFVLLSTPLAHGRGRGFPWRELVLVYLPAAVHEEIVFRGYPLQKLRTIDTRLSVAITSIVFAVMHIGNRGITPLAMLNLLLAGVLLALAYLRYERLWFPIGLHLAWNLMSGPFLGYDVSGFVPDESVLTVSGRGPEWLTGGRFGIEGSVWAILVEVAGIAFLLLNAQRKSAALRRIP